jgi:hypothetical protein
MVRTLLGYNLNHLVMCLACRQHEKGLPIIPLKPNCIVYTSHTLEQEIPLLLMQHCWEALSFKAI